MNKVSVQRATGGEAIEGVVMSKAEYKKHRKALKGWNKLENSVTGEVLAIPPMHENADKFMEENQKH